MHRVRIVLVAVVAIALVTLSIGAQAASGFADPAFQTQWQTGEAVTPNFWGPLETAKDGQQEPYKDASGGSRLVQYFDKGRMELTNGAVTNGLLATEIIKGQVQIGDNTFQPLAPPNIAIAGDASNPAPTYAGLASQGGGPPQADGEHSRRRSERVDWRRWQPRQRRGEQRSGDADRRVRRYHPAQCRRRLRRPIAPRQG